MCGVAARTGRRGDEVIRIDALWVCTAPVDMRAGADRLLACVVQTLGAAQAGVRGPVGQETGISQPDIKAMACQLDEL